MDVDMEEIGKTIQLLYDAIMFIESTRGNLSPFVPTQNSVGEQLVEYIDAFIAKLKEEKSTVVYYEPGCGDASFARKVALSIKSLYIVCLEIDKYLAYNARKRLESLYADVVIGDLSSFRPRRADIVYAYLLPRAVKYVLHTLQGLGSIVLSLDYPAEDSKGVYELAILRVDNRSLYVYVS